MSSMTAKPVQLQPVAWICTRPLNGKPFDAPFMAMNEAYVKAHKDYDWQPLVYKSELDCLIHDHENVMTGRNLEMKARMELQAALSAETQRRQAAEVVVELAVSNSVDSLRLCEELALQYLAKYPKEPAT